MFFSVERVSCTNRTRSEERHTKSRWVKSVFVFKSFQQATRRAKLDIENSTAMLTIEMMVGRLVPIETLRADRTWHFSNETIGDEDL